jgi:phosphoribosyl 1,2-cyclic phosphodiesterase
MSLYISSLNSGSNGNCYYVGNKDEAVLIDAGISCRETERRMKRLELSIKKIKAIFVTHEHSDHIYGVSVLSRKYQLPVYLTAGTLQHGRLRLKEHLTNTFNVYEPIRIGNLTITGFPKLHDAVDPCSFIVSSDTTNVGVFTDIGWPCEHVTRQFKQCHAAFLESNYDEVMLENGHYSLNLKRRIRGGKGHLSNKQALQLFTRHKAPFMSHLFLSHLSADNNCPKLVEQLFTEKAGRTRIVVASRYEETSVFHIHSSSGQLVNRSRFRAPMSPLQLSLFQ